MMKPTIFIATQNSEITIQGFFLFVPLNIIMIMGEIWFVNRHKPIDHHYMLTINSDNQ